ncbi:MAG: alpha/beta hydrolase [Bacillota bacterium]|nr:alpha/beta hydrolase [Bacillota bacterium]
MIIKPDNYTYETMPEYMDDVPGARRIKADLDLITVDYIPDVVYDTKDGVDLHLQILQPKIFNKEDVLFPCIIYVQGSAWKKQNCYRDIPNLSKLASRGYFVAIVEYRHSEIAHFPAQIIDTKNAARYVLAHKEEYCIDANRTIIMGNSSGGHTSSMVGMTFRSGLFDEPINDEILDFKGIVNLYGSIELTLRYGFPITLDSQLPTSPEGMVMGWNILEHMEETEKANSKTYAAYDYPPMLIMHGTKDRLVFCQQSVNLFQACQEAGKDVTFYLVEGSDHGGPAFYQEEVLDIYEAFFAKCFKKNNASKEAL